MKIHIDDTVKTGELPELVRKGAKFIAYRYIISVPVFYPTKRISKLFFIKPGEKSSKYSTGYNLLSLLLGIWGLPFGPPNTVRAFILNLKGGIDFTEDVMVNLKDDTLVKKEVILEKPARFFLKPSKSNLNELKKVFRMIKKLNIISEPVIAGFYINVAKDEKPYHVIGVSSELTDETIRIIRQELYKKFFKQTKFEVVSFQSNNYEHIEMLRNEGEPL